MDRTLDALFTRLHSGDRAAFSYSWTELYPQLTIKPDGGLLFWMPRQQQSFFWLMPLAVLSAFGLWSIHQRRRLLALIGGGAVPQNTACSIRQLRTCIQAVTPEFPARIDTRLAESIEKYRA